MRPDVDFLSSTDLMKLVACRRMKRLIVQCSVMLPSHMLTLFPLTLKKQSKAESEQATPAEPKAEEPPAGVAPAVGLDTGPDTGAERPVEGAVVSTTSLPPSVCLPCHSHARLLTPCLPSHPGSLRPNHLHTHQGSPRSNSLWSL